ncbi:MAG: cysteine synthase family protein [Sedimentibacter sp.]|uniref:PLP-dependent cysteine synthase family protein n=1 Tax=Sedimentibacter sp. TaxID=1960295 RepID=UPI0031588403
MNQKLTEKFNGISAMINNTPLLEITLRFKGIDRKVYAKAEYYNFTGSIKDRIVLHIMKQFYEEGTLSEGDSIVEATSGNTGISISAIGAFLGNPVTIYMPDWMCQERVKLMESFGAKVVSVSRENGGFKGCLKLAEEMGTNAGTCLTRQFSNMKNIDAHYETTGNEILLQLAKLDKKPNAFVAGVGTGGTIMGVKKALQKMYPHCRAYPLEPESSPMMTTKGEKFGSHRIAGIGDDFIPEIIRLDELDEVITVDDSDAINMARKLASQLGIGVGISSGANFLGALKAQDILGRDDAVVVTVFADDNKKYLSTDLMKKQDEKPCHLTPQVELVGFKAVR